ncbi:DUF4419 domain-containing protein [Archangium sp.]|uniref:DUF4419 domain-containing protein n=1 Tax=Archangium sp. TaxID=1872627 RepID=UPI00286BC830|nr:DUF4419 domain-containing protein [Archangium sp.]
MRTFVVSETEVVRQPVKDKHLGRIADCLELLTGAQLEASGCSSGHLLLPTSLNPLIATLNLAYRQHYAIALRPDDFWLCITQGMANHINKFSEEVRSIFVQHQGKERIEVRRDNFVKGSAENDWPNVFSEFDAQIADRIGDPHKVLKARFGTTTAIDEAAYSIVLMDAMSAYFSYAMMTMCALTEITLLGEKEDWRELYSRVSTLSNWWAMNVMHLQDPEKVSLEWWFAPLLKHLEVVAQTAEGGEIDPKFWGDFYKLDNMHGSGGSKTTGWVNLLFPYLTDHVTRLPTTVNQVVRYWKEVEGREGPGTDAYPSGVSKVPFLWKYFLNEYRMNFLGGFVGIGQNPQTFALSPATGWGVCEEM